MTENELAAIAVDICFKIHTKLGPGLLESVYEAAFAYELDKRNIFYERQKGIIANYEDVILDVGFRADIIMESKLIVEIKSVEHLEKVHHKTVLTYLKLTGIKLAILVILMSVLLKKECIVRYMDSCYSSYPAKALSSQRIFSWCTLCLCVKYICCQSQ